MVPIGCGLLVAILHGGAAGQIRHEAGEKLELERPNFEEFAGGIRQHFEGFQRSEAQL